MSSSLLKLFRSGGLGDLQIGMTRAEVIKVMGPPPFWSGKPPIIGWVILRYEESNVWWYYGDAVGISFDEKGTAESIVIDPEKVVKDQLPFRDWPFWH